MQNSAVASSFLDILQRIVNLALTALILGSLLLFGVQFVHVDTFQTSWPVIGLHHYGDPIVTRLAALLHLPQAKLYMPLVMAGIVYVVILLVDRLFGVLYEMVQMARLRQMQKPAAKTPAKEGVESEEARAKLYKEYRQIEKALKDAKKKRCTFLSVDVVGSTSMKQGETEIAITSTFRAYEELLRRTFKATRSWKESWTPDGVMICFQNRQDAVAAAQTILTKLLLFNEHDNAMKTAFNVRCGINEGDVVIFEDSDVEKLVEHVIDVAGHMQKYAAPGSLLLSKDVYDVLEDTAGFKPAGKEVDGYQTYEWWPSTS